MRILFLCHRIPYPPNKGDKIRAFHQLKALAARHEVDVFTLADDAADLEHRAALASHCHSVTVSRISAPWARLRSLPFLLTSTPLTIPYFYSAELKRAVTRALQCCAYDRIFVYCSAMGQYVDEVKDIPIITDFVDVDSDKWAQYAAFTRFPASWVYHREARCLRDYERHICALSSCVLVTTEREADLARKISPAPVEVIPNGIDTEYFTLPDQRLAREAAAILFTGDMSYFPNEEAVVWFARNVFPRVRQSFRNARFVVVGRNPGKRVLDLRQTEGVEVTGFVPDVRPYLWQAKVAVAPFSIAAGIQNKILEAMATGLPVVSTSRAARGLTPRVAARVDIADAPEEMAARIITLLGDRESARRKGAEGRSSVAAEYCWKSSLDRMLELVDGAGSSQAVQRPAAHRTILMVLMNAYDPDPRVRQEALALIGMGYAVRLLAWDRERKAPATERMEGLEVERVFVSSTHGRGITQLLFYARVYLRMLALGWKSGFDAVHCHDLDALPVGYVLGKLTGKPIVYDAHESFPDMLEGSVPQIVRRGLLAFENYFIRRIDLLITVGERLRRYFASRGARRSVVVGNWKRLAEFSREAQQNQAVRRQLGIPGDALVVVAITQLLKDRKLEELLEAIDAAPGVYAIVGGKGVLEERVTEWARKNPRIRYVGYLRGSEIGDCTCAADVVYYGFDPRNPNARFSAPNKLYEALAAGKPLITGDFGEIAEVVRQADCGIILPEYSALEVGRALDALRDEKLRQRLSWNAKQFGASFMNWDKGAEILEREYSAILPRAPGRKHHEAVISAEVGVK